MGQAQLACDFQAGEIGQMDVDQGRLGAMFTDVIQGGLTGVEYEGVETLAAQQSQQRGGDGLIVVNHEDTPASRDEALGLLARFPETAESRRIAALTTFC